MDPKKQKKKKNAPFNKLTQSLGTIFYKKSKIGFKDKTEHSEKLCRGILMNTT